MTVFEAKELYEEAHAVIRSDKEKALKILEYLKEKLPSADTYHDLIYLHCFSGNYSIVASLFTTYYLYEGNTCRYYHDYGYFFYKIGQIDDAIYNFEKALTFNEKDDRVLMNLGLCKLKKAEYEQAENSFQISFKYNKTYNALLCYAVSRLIQGKELDQKVISLFKNCQRFALISNAICYTTDVPQEKMSVVNKIIELLLRNAG